jgi:hypothetical protein
MKKISPPDSSVSAYVGNKLQINRGNEQHVGVVEGWVDKNSERRWRLKASTGSMTFLPSDGWQLYLWD